MIRLGLIVYALIGLFWGVGVTGVRFIVDGREHYPRPWVWIPATILAWPWSMYISARELIRGMRGDEWVCGVCGVTDWENHKPGCTNDPEQRT